MILISDRDFEEMARVIEMVRNESGEGCVVYNAKRRAKLAVRRIKARREKEQQK